MKQIITCLNRLFENKPPLKTKWQARKNSNNLLFLYHYHHLILVYHIKNQTIEFEWSETSTDKRGLSSAKQYLNTKSANNNHKHLQPY